MNPRGLFRPRHHAFGKRVRNAVRDIPFDGRFVSGEDAALRLCVANRYSIETSYKSRESEELKDEHVFLLSLRAIGRSEAISNVVKRLLRRNERSSQ